MVLWIQNLNRFKKNVLLFKQTPLYRSTFIYFIPIPFRQTPTYITKLPRQRAQLVDGVQGHHCHGGHCQTPAHHVCPRRKHVGVVDWRVERGKAHHHHELWENVFRTKSIENRKASSCCSCSCDVNVLLFLSAGPGCQDTKVDLFLWACFHVWVLLMFLSTLTRRKHGLTNFQHSLQYLPGRWPIISLISSLNRSTPNTHGSTWYSFIHF